MGCAVGPTKILIRHSDILIKPLLEAPTTAEKMERIIGFELRSLLSEDQHQHMRFAFRPANNVVGNDVRVLALVTKQPLIAEIDSIVKSQGGKLTSLSHPFIGLAESIQHQLPEVIQQPTLVLHGEADQLMVMLMSDGDILAATAHNPGLAELEQQDSTAIGMSLAGALQSKLRMLKSQINLPRFYA